MSELTLSESLRRAARRLQHRPRRSRSDAGRSRLDPRVESRLQALLRRPERPAVRDVQRALQAYCRRHALELPSRATIYNALARVEPPSFAVAELPSEVQRTLHNVGGRRVPGHQLVFAAFNYGDTRALSYAAGLPWSCLRRAERLNGWRPKSLALLRAVIACRGA